MDDCRITRAVIERNRAKGVELGVTLPQNDHAPCGYSILMQHFQGETHAEAIRKTLLVFDVPEADLVAVPGHYACLDPRGDAWSWRNDGWMVFLKDEPIAIGQEVARA